MYYLLLAETDLADQAFCAAFALSLALLLIALCGRVGVALLLVGALAACVRHAGFVKLMYLDEPLMGPDLHYFLNATTLDVIAHYPAMWFKGGAALLVGVAFAALLWRIESPWRAHARLPRVLLALTALASLGLTTWPHGPFGDVYGVDTWDFIAHSKRNPTSAFLSSLSRMEVTIPAYSRAAASALDWGGNATAAHAAPERRPDIVVVLEESTLDPRQWAACNVPRCTFGMFQADRYTAASGPLRVHTYGGATWTSEFTFFAGMPQTLFGPQGIYAPYNLAPRLRQSLPRELKALGYRTIAIYPMPRHFVNAGEAYSEYGFDDFHDSNDLGLVWESTDADLMHRFEDIRRRERARGDQPLFFMILTMRQHGPHDYPLESLPAPWNKPPLATVGKRLDRNLGNYLYRLKQSSDALAELRQALFADGRPTLLAHFGDHHPSFDGLEPKLQSGLAADLHAQASEVTYYRIDSNFAHAPVAGHEVLDLAYLGGLILDVAGLPKNPYFEANTRLRERCDGRFIDCPNRAALDSWRAYVFGTLRVFE